MSIDQEGTSTQAIYDVLQSLQNDGKLSEAPPGSLVRGWVSYVEIIDPSGESWWVRYNMADQGVSTTVGMTHLLHENLLEEVLGRRGRFDGE